MSASIFILGLMEQKTGYFCLLNHPHSKTNVLSFTTCVCMVLHFFIAVHTYKISLEVILTSDKRRHDPRCYREVLCLEFMYLRVITGCGDGRLRIWNMVTGQCCRIMRGNSRSDPILDILAIRDR